MAHKSRSSQMTPRKRSKIRIRSKITGSSERPRISVFRSSKHTYAQLIVDDKGKTLVSASTLDPLVAERLKVDGSQSDGGSFSPKSVNAAKVVGVMLAERCKALGVESVVFDRNGFEYWGRIRAVAEGAREGGLKF